MTDTPTALAIPKPAAWAAVLALGVGPLGASSLMSDDVKALVRELGDVRLAVESLRSDVRALSEAQGRYAAAISDERQERRALEERIRRLETRNAK